MPAPFRIGVDGGATKTECILVDAAGEIVARHLAPGCNPNLLGAEQARLVITDALCHLVQDAAGHPRPVASTHLFVAGSRTFWRDTALHLTGFGEITVADDSLPVLELATCGQPGLVLHAGTGSFVAARDPAGNLHYAGGTGWRFGDPAGGYDLGRRAISRALLELQGWTPMTRLGPTVRDATGLGTAADAAAVTRFFYQHPEPNRAIAALAPALLRLAAEGDATVLQLVTEAVEELAALATRVATRLFPDRPLDTLPAGLSGPILTHSAVVPLLTARSPLPLVPVTGTPIEGVHRLVLRGGR